MKITQCRNNSTIQYYNCRKR